MTSMISYCPRQPSRLGVWQGNKPFKFKQRLKYKGRWRVRVKYAGKKPFRSSASRWVTFKVK